MLKKFILIFSTLVVLVIIFAVSVQIKYNSDQTKIYRPREFTIHEEVLKADVNLGKRLFNVRNGCIDCHGNDLAGTQVMEDPAMGSIWGANITSKNLSTWSDEELARAIRYGVHKTGRSLQFMPAFDYVGLSKEDIAALIAYIRSVPPSDRPNHVNTFGPVAKTLSFFGQMPVLFPAKVIDQTGGFNDKPSEAPTKEFGRYLANSCTGCHGAEFRGGRIPGGDPSWPKALNIRLGSNPVWNEKVFIETIRTGISPTTKTKLRPPMPTPQLAQLNDIELKALWEFLSTLH